MTSKQLYFSFRLAPKWSSDRNGNLLELDDDSGGGTNARLVRSVGPGKYIVAATSFWDNETGAYQLAIN